MNRLFTILTVLCLTSVEGPAYSVLTHEAIIDTTWDSTLKALILERFPQSTPEELIEAHAYAYGGCIIQDMGYYPLASRFFSDLVHYVRSGEFIVNLLAESQTREEYAFALGAMAHYAADTQGHSVAVNRAVALEYPKLKRKYGEVVTYYEKPSAHMKVEFAFDVLQVARGNYAPESYRNMIGFKVARPVLERAFLSTYSLELKDLFLDLDLAIGTYRFTINSIIPRMTKIAWNIHKDELQKAKPGIVRDKFVYNLSKASYHKEWGAKYKKPSISARVLALFMGALPKIGPLKALSFHPVSPEADRLFQSSFNKTLDLYRQSLQDHKRSQLRLDNRDFDTGELTTPGEYPMCDNAYSKLAVKLAGQQGRVIDPGLRRNILTFFANPELQFATKKDGKQWQATLNAVEKLRSPDIDAMQVAR